MKSKQPPNFKFSRYASLMALLATAVNTWANPQGMAVVSGSATTAQNGSQLNITTSADAHLDWQSFNIAEGETTTFLQPSTTSIVWNRINDANPSQIFGHLNANGMVVLMNSSGFYFGPNSVVKAAGFVATTATPFLDPGSGGQWEFNGPPPVASIVNYGQIKVDSGGQLYLIARKIENHGILSAPDGTLGLYAGKAVELSERPDGRGLSVDVTLPEGSVDNYGKLVADAGSIWMQAQTVNQDGIVQANSVQKKNGVIELIASDAVNLGENSIITANGDDSTASDGGEITIKSDHSFSDTVGSQISVAGGAVGGNGGAVEISAPIVPEILSTVDGHATAGSLGGRLLLDPLNIVIGNTGSGVASGGTVDSGSSPGATLNLNLNSAFLGFSQIDLQAQNNITLSAGVTWNLANSTGLSLPGSLLKLEAGNDIIIGNGASIVGDAGWSVTLQAGRNFGVANTVNAGLGNITFTGSGGLQTQDGAISLLAGNNITVNSGYVRTMGGGSITATAVAGSVNTGTKASGFKYVTTGSGYTVDPNLGGVSTGAGGDVNITAGLDIISLLPISGNSDAGSGAFGPQAGNVTLTAGRNVTGHYVVANGNGTINAGNSAGIDINKELALSLISGGWTVNAAKDIVLQEVRNPNGIFNSLGISTSTTKHYFDYSADAYVNLNAGNSVQLLGNALPRNTGLFDQAIPPIYAPILNIHAGAGGVQVGNNIILFPSPIGQLNITTTDGGSLLGTKAGDLAQFIMSDSSAVQYKTADTFGTDDHAETPIHLDDPDPVTLNIAGDMNNLLLVTPKRTEITVGGSMYNARVNIQNLHSTDVSFLNVAGDILNRNEFSSMTVAVAPDFSPFFLAYELSSSLAALPNQFYYDAATHTLTFQGRMTEAQRQSLLNLVIQPIDPLTGQPQVDYYGNPVLKTVQVLDAATVNALFAASQDVPLNSNTGYIINGPGTLNLNAHNLDLGATWGIRSVGPSFNSALAPLGSSGAAININLTGNLDMFSTTISTIAGGDINLHADGNLNLGSSVFAANDNNARGIFTTTKADVNVIAGGDINVNGSRIATYDGGNVTVESQHGNVNAGSGGQGVVTIQLVSIDPITHATKTYSLPIPGSGILAMTIPSGNQNFPGSKNTVGNILVETPEGDIIGNAGGIIQFALNGVNSPNATVQLLAGYELRDINDIPLLANQMDLGMPISISTGRNIDVGGSGVIGVNIIAKASGHINGLFVGDHANLDAAGPIIITGIFRTVDLSSGEGIVGKVIAVDHANTSGGGPTLDLISNDANGGGSSFAQINVAGATSQSAASTTDQEAKKLAIGVDDDDKKDAPNLGEPTPTVTKVSRVTVIFPEKT